MLYPATSGSVLGSQANLIWATDSRGNNNIKIAASKKDARTNFRLGENGAPNFAMPGTNCLILLPNYGLITKLSNLCATNISVHRKAIQMTQRYLFQEACYSNLSA